MISVDDNRFYFPSLGHLADLYMASRLGWRWCLQRRSSLSCLRRYSSGTWPLVEAA